MANKGIWKTGLLALFITLAGTLAIMRVPSDNSNTVKVLPQVVMGSYDGGSTNYRTVVQVINIGTTPAHISAAFYNADGTDSTATYATGLGSAAETFNNGKLAATTLPESSTLVITADSVSSGVTNWGTITSYGGHAIVNCAIEIRDVTTGVLRTRAAVAASDADMRQFVIPRMRVVSTGLDIGVALVNTGSLPAIITMTLRDAIGHVVNTNEIHLNARSQNTGFVREFFPEANPTRDGFVMFTSTSPQFAAAALAYEGASLTDFPVTRLR